VRSSSSACAAPAAASLPRKAFAGAHALLRCLRRSARRADTGIALEKDMAIELRDDAASGVNEDGSTWYGVARASSAVRCAHNRT
jgi:hypothetical protein